MRAVNKPPRTSNNKPFRKRSRFLVLPRNGDNAISQRKPRLTAGKYNNSKGLPRTLAEILERQALNKVRMARGQHAEYGELYDDVPIR